MCDDNIVICLKSFASNFLLNVMISLLISLQDIFKAAQHSLEALSVNRRDSASVDSLHTSLPVNIVN